MFSLLLLSYSLNIQMRFLISGAVGSQHFRPDGTQLEIKILVGSRLCKASRYRSWSRWLVKITPFLRCVLSTSWSYVILRFGTKHYWFYFFHSVGVLLPIMMPLGSTGGCQTTLTSVRRTSGNTSLMGGPGTKNNSIQRRRHYMLVQKNTTEL